MLGARAGRACHWQAAKLQPGVQGSAGRASLPLSDWQAAKLQGSAGRASVEEGQGKAELAPSSTRSRPPRHRRCRREPLGRIRPGSSHSCGLLRTPAEVAEQMCETETEGDRKCGAEVRGGGGRVRPRLLSPAGGAGGGGGGRRRGRAGVPGPRAGAARTGGSRRGAAGGSGGWPGGRDRGGH